MAMYGEGEVEKTFDRDFISEELLQAQWAEFTELKMIIAEISARVGRAIDLLDIGIGDARISKHLSRIQAMWEMINTYYGIDNSVNALQKGKQIIAEENIGNKVVTQFLDACNLEQLKREFDLIIMTWFTAGNFYPDGFDFKNYPNGDEGRLDLSKNEKLTSILGNAYRLLKPGGELVLGSCYIDNEETRKLQNAFYKKCGWKILTDEKDTFTATDTGFWSQRFTREKIIQYLPFVPEANISFIPLDPYDYAMMVRVRK